MYVASERLLLLLKRDRAMELDHLFVIFKRFFCFFFGFWRRSGWKGIMSAVRSILSSSVR